MDKKKHNKIGIILVKSVFAVAILGAVTLPFVTGEIKDPGNPLSHKESTQFDSYMTEVFTFESTSDKQTYTLDDLISNLNNFVSVPDGGTSWRVFGETGQDPYTYIDEEGMEWSGARPIFSDKIQKLDGQEIIIQGYMFPLGQEEEQPMFLLGPFPLSCPYHYHVTPNLIIEVHAKDAVEFSYDAVNIKGTLELVPKDDEYNVFYRLNNAEMIL